jgi:hypothetical protein
MFGALPQLLATSSLLQLLEAPGGSAQYKQCRRLNAPSGEARSIVDVIFLWWFIRCFGGWMQTRERDLERERERERSRGRLEVEVGSGRSTCHTSSR